LRRSMAVAGVVGAAVLVPSAALAADGDTYPLGSTPPEQPAVVQGGAVVSGETASSGSSDTLPFTGGDVLGLAAVGAVAALGGGALMRASRRSRASV